MVARLNVEREVISAVEHRTAIDEPLKLMPRRGTPEAPHLTHSAVEVLGSCPLALRAADPRTTLDLELQRDIERPLARAAPRRRRGWADADGRYRAHADERGLAGVGSRDFADAPALGQNDGVRALRQPGSALKPFVYGAYFDARHPYDSVIDHKPTSFGTPTGRYTPLNFDQQFHGQVNIRTALGSSLNVPAVIALAEVGVPRVLDLLRAAGLATLDQSSDHYGLGLALGNGEVRLVDLAAAYATLGRLGRPMPVTWWAGAERAPGARILSEETCFVLLDMLADDRARGVGFGHAGPFDLPFRLAGRAARPATSATTGPLR